MTRIRQTKSPKVTAKKRTAPPIPKVERTVSAQTRVSFGDFSVTWTDIGSHRGDLDIEFPGVGSVVLDRHAARTLHAVLGVAIKEAGDG